jgi:hypothetical protein
VPKLPNAKRAVVDIAKLRAYSLNPTPDVGKHKARVFRAVLGLTIDDAEWLRERVLEATVEGEAMAGPSSIFGQKHILDFSLTCGARSAKIRTAWIIEYGTDFPRLTSCYVL